LIAIAGFLNENSDRINGGSSKKFAITIKIIDKKKQSKTILLLTRKLLYTWVIGSLEMSDI